MIPNDALRFRVGEVVTVRTRDGHVLRGRVSFVAPERVMLVYAGGTHSVMTGAIAAVAR